MTLKAWVSAVSVVMRGNSMIVYVSAQRSH